MGCGTGYSAPRNWPGCRSRREPFHLFPQAVAVARSAYPLPNLTCLAAPAAAHRLPGCVSFQLITCFEVIEHIADWQTLLKEAQRLLARGGQFIVSTPNKLYYA